MDEAQASVTRARHLLADFAARDRSIARVAEAVATDRSLTYHETLDFRKEPLAYVPSLAMLLRLGLAGGTGALRLLHLGASHGVFCRFLQAFPGVSLAAALDLSRAALRHGRAWGLRAAVAADAISLAACRGGSVDVILAESLYVPGYWRPCDIARSLAGAARVLRPNGLLLIQEWGFDVARDFRPELAELALQEVCRITATAPTQQGERPVTCFAFGARPATAR